MGWAAAKFLLYGLLGLVIRIIIAFICYKKEIFPKTSKVLNIIRLIFTVYIPLIFSLTLGTYGTIKSVHKATHKKVDDTAKPIIALVHKELPPFKKYLATNWEKIKKQNKTLAESFGEYMSKFYYKPNDDSFTEKKKAKFINYYTLNAGKWVLTSVVVAGMAYGGVEVDKHQLKYGFKFIKNIDMSQIDKNFIDIFMNALHKTIRQFFTGLYLTFLIPLVIFISIPFLYALAIKLYNNRKAKY